VSTVRPRTILVVEDEPTVADLLVTLLRDEGYGVELARTGREALGVLVRERAPSDNLALVLLDMMLPDHHGLAVLQDPAVARLGVPVIALSADAPTLAAAVPLGAVAALSKPFDLDELLRLVAHYCRP
jgi:CheY-like chemotaxis protein